MNTHTMTRIQLGRVSAQMFSVDSVKLRCLLGILQDHGIVPCLPEPYRVILTARHLHSTVCWRGGVGGVGCQSQGQTLARDAYRGHWQNGNSGSPN